MNTCDTPKQGKKLRFSEDGDEIQLISPSVSPKSTCQLPMKKRKLTTDAKSTNHTPWVATLNTEHKLMLENNSWLCSEIINVCMNILAKQFPIISGFQSTGLAPLFDEDKQCWTENFGTFTSQDTPCVQIPHTGKSHWITSLQTKKDSAVYVLDSYSKDFRLTPSTEIQLSAIYSHGKRTCLLNYLMFNNRQMDMTVVFMLLPTWWNIVVKKNSTLKDVRSLLRNTCDYI
ncbi:unnamed protein product [Mytilus coruscus]|uniref:Ubiquitin-like protease family profile domain-containing protein n=1 Tax=Mytilus coruscus TaxID=42192 RepID=A0A6J8CRQ2_MYTCO|nr:unnamed protein product [Mytilus coruscus]